MASNALSLHRKMNGDGYSTEDVNWQRACISAERQTRHMLFVAGLQQDAHMSDNDRIIMLKCLLREACRQELVRTDPKARRQALLKWQNLEFNMLSVLYAYDTVQSGVDAVRAIISSMRWWDKTGERNYERFIYQQDELDQRSSVRYERLQQLQSMPRSVLIRVTTG